MINNSIKDLIQNVIDKNELATGYWMFLAVKNAVPMSE